MPDLDLSCVRPGRELGEETCMPHNIVKGLCGRRSSLTARVPLYRTTNATKTCFAMRLSGAAVERRWRWLYGVGVPIVGSGVPSSVGPGVLVGGAGVGVGGCFGSATSRSRS